MNDALRVSPAVTRLTVYRRLQYGIVPAGDPRNYGPIYEFGVVFLKKSRFLSISSPFSDFSGLKIDHAEAHARGFAPLWPVARGNSNWKVALFRSKK